MFLDGVYVPTKSSDTLTAREVYYLEEIQFTSMYYGGCGWSNFGNLLQRICQKYCDKRIRFVTETTQWAMLGSYWDKMMENKEPYAVALQFPRYEDAREFLIECLRKVLG